MKVVSKWYPTIPKAVRVNSRFRLMLKELRERPLEWGLVKVTTTYNRANCFARKCNDLTEHMGFKFRTRQKDANEFHVYGSYQSSPGNESLRT